MTRASFICACGVALAAVVAGQPAPSVVAFVGVNIIPMDRDRLLQNQTVVVRGDRIAEIGPASRVKAPQGATVVTASGKYLMPALAEMHAHVPPGDQVTDRQIERVLWLYARGGIGTIRGMLGHARHLPLRTRLNSGEQFGPMLYTSGPSLNGMTVPTPEAAVNIVEEQKAAGYDFLKIHPGIPRGAYDAMAERAHKLRIPFAGHVPADVGVLRAIEARQLTIDHLDGYVEAMVSKDKLAQPGLFGLGVIMHADESKIPELVKTTKAAGVWNVPTQILVENLVTEEDPDAMAKRPEIKYVESAQLTQWITMKKKALAETTPEQRKRYIDVRRKLIKALHASGAGLLLGSDAPQWWNVPGFSIHRELESIVAAGLTPFQALETGTRNVAAFFRQLDGTGTVESGKRADLLLLGANPLADITNTWKIDGVMIRGRWAARDEMDKRLEATP
jgi:imidazolonepropionase-like amidohydrolase